MPSCPHVTGHLVSVLLSISSRLADYLTPRPVPHGDVCLGGCLIIYLPHQRGTLSRVILTKSRNSWLYAAHNSINNRGGWYFTVGSMPACAPHFKASQLCYTPLFCDLLTAKAGWTFQRHANHLIVVIRQRCIVTLPVVLSFLKSCESNTCGTVLHLCVVWFDEWILHLWLKVIKWICD